MRLQEYVIAVKMIHGVLVKAFFNRGACLDPEKAIKSESPDINKMNDDIHRISRFVFHSNKIQGFRIRQYQ